MTTKTCKQTYISSRTHCRTTGYRPHIVPEWDASGYATCEACGREIYVGQGPRAPYAMQAAEGEYMAAFRRGDLT